jgi:hypothetical protein
MTETRDSDKYITPQREYPNARMDQVLRNVIEECEKKWATRPRVVLACAGFDDEHWQVFHPEDMVNPAYTIDKDAIAYEHYRG